MNHPTRTGRGNWQARLLAALGFCLNAAFANAMLLIRPENVFMLTGVAKLEDVGSFAECSAAPAPSRVGSGSAKRIAAKIDTGE